MGRRRGAKVTAAAKAKAAVKKPKAVVKPKKSFTEKLADALTSEKEK